MGKNKHTFIILITLLLLLTNCSCSKCISTVVMINVKYDSFSELRFRSVPISEYELYRSEYKTSIKNKCDIVKIISEIEEVKKNSKVIEFCNIDVRMRISIMSDLEEREVYIDNFYLVEKNKCYEITSESLTRILTLIDNGLVKELTY